MPWGDNKEQVRQYNQAYYLSHKEDIKKQVKEYRLSHLNEYREASLMRLYRMTVADFDAMFESQEGRCAVCRMTPEESSNKRAFCVDHDHACCSGGKSCGKCVRGILCHACNLALGRVEGKLGAIVKYLKIDLDEEVS